jgi:hypothetical protein
MKASLFRNLCVKPRSCLCGVPPQYASARYLVFLDLAKNRALSKMITVCLTPGAKSAFSDSGGR